MTVNTLMPVPAARLQPPCLALADERGNVILYYQGETNRCPHCGATQWFVGRSNAACARCDAAIPLAFPSASPSDLNLNIESEAA